MERAWTPFVAAAATIVMLTVGWAGARAPVEPRSVPLPEHHLEAAIAALVDVERTRHGLTPLQLSPVLAQAARHHALEMGTLGFVSHTSPTPGNASPRDRVANAGGTMTTVGENLASLGPMGFDLAERVVEGWMGSPGHRDNVLRPEWSHVGYGLWEGADGRVLVVQVFAVDPNPLVFAHASASARGGVRLRLDVAGTADGFVMIGIGGRAGRATAVRAGEVVSLEVEGLAADARTHLQLGWSPSEGAPAIGQASGWLDTGTGTFELDHVAANASARVVDHAVDRPVPAVQLQLAFERAALDLRVLVNASPITPTVTGTHLELLLPGDRVSQVLVGRSVGGSRIEVLHALEVHVAPSLTVTPARAGD